MNPICLAPANTVGAFLKLTRPMSNQHQIDKCKNFLLANGYKKDLPIGDGESYTNGDGKVLVDIQSDCIRFIDDDGDFLTIPTGYYSLIGAMVANRLIPYEFNTNQ